MSTGTPLVQTKACYLLRDFASQPIAGIETIVTAVRRTFAHC
jgi:hypothetical protein